LRKTQELLLTGRPVGKALPSLQCAVLKRRRVPCGVGGFKSLTTSQIPYSEPALPSIKLPARPSIVVSLLTFQPARTRFFTLRQPCVEFAPFEIIVAIACSKSNFLLSFAGLVKSQMAKMCDNRLQ
jgi:hypothetical protein